MSVECGIELTGSVWLDSSEHATELSGGSFRAHSLSHGEVLVSVVTVSEIYCLVTVSEWSAE